MLAVEGRFAYSLLLGIFAAVNPCGFVMLPTYLMYFLGSEAQQTGSRRKSVERALVVSAATSAGFLTVFLIVGTIARLFTATIQDNAKYASLVIGLLLIVLGGFMLAGWKPPIVMPQLGGGEQRKRTVRSMFGFGVAYAVASIGCTIGFLISAIFGSFGTNGVASGVLSVVLYGVGMALVVTALTVTLAFASGGLLKVLRGGLRFMDRAAALFIILTGVYLTWYWYGAISERSGDAVTGKVESWQSDLTTYLQRQGVWKIGLILGLVVVAGIGYVLRSHQSSRVGDR